jgi:UDPglucose 6-dehydrogenase
MTNKNISIIGVGRLGICVGLCLEHAGYNVLGVDVFPDYVDKINNKTLFSPEPSVNKMLSNSINFNATTNFDEALVFSDIIFIYVATPSSGGEKFYDHTTLGNILMKINERKVQNKHIVIGCTVTPGYIKEVGNFLIKDCKNTSLSYNPEFIAQGDIINGIFAADFILIGEGSKEAGNKLQEIYEKLGESYGHIPVIHRMSPASAEITKLSVNCFVTTKIAFANMIGDVADLTIGANKFDILNAVGADSRVGKKYLMPGYGFGGPCFPRDNRALGGYIQQMGIDPLIPIATDTLNTLHTKFQTQQILDKKIDTVVIIGVGYKEKCSVAIIEESAKLKIGQELVRSGIRVIVKDIKLLIDCVKLEYGNLFEYEIVESLNDLLIVTYNENMYILK